MNYFKMLRARHWAWVLVLAIVGIWWPAFILTMPPEFVQQTVNPGVLNVCMVVALFGTIVKIFGFLASQLPDRLGVIGVSVELAGLILASIGPASYVVISAAAAYENSTETVFPNSGFIFAIALCAVFLYRAIIIVPRFFFEAHDSAKDDA